MLNPIVQRTPAPPKPRRNLLEQLGPKPVLEMERVPHFRVFYGTLERYIETVFRLKDFDFFIATGCKPGECPEYVVDGKLPSVTWVQRANELRTGKRTRSIPLILAVLAADKYIPTGLYVINTHMPPDPVGVYTLILEQTRNPLHPDAIAYKEKHRGNETFMTRAAILEQTLLERLAA